MNKPITPKEMEDWVGKTWDRCQKQAWSDMSISEKVRVRIMQEAYDCADRGEVEAYNSVKVICGRIVSEPIKEEITMDEGYHCVICGRFLPADEGGVIVHDDIPHPPDMTFDEEENTQ